MDEHLKHTFARRLSYIRRELIWCTQAAIAERIGVSRSRISHIEMGLLAPRLEEIVAYRNIAVQMVPGWTDSYLFEDNWNAEAEDAPQRARTGG